MTPNIVRRGELRPAGDHAPQSWCLGVVVYFSIWHDVVQPNQVQVVYLTAGHKLVDFDCAGRFKRDVFKLVFADLQVPVGIETRRGYDWSERYPLINQAALRLRRSSFVIDGEAVVLGPDGISDFDALHTGKRNAEVRLSARDSPP